MALHTLIKDSMSCSNIFRIISILIFISTLLIHTASASTSTNALNTYKRFIKVKCNSTTYSAICYKSLSPYASKIKTNTFTLTKTSVYLALNATKAAYITMNKLCKTKGNLTHAETEVIADCKDNIGDTVDLLQQSSDGLQDLNGISTNEERFEWDGIKTWMSASITNESTCTDEADEMEVRPSLLKKIKPIIAKVAQKNSIALALVNNLSY